MWKGSARPLQWQQRNFFNLHWCPFLGPKTSWSCETGTPLCPTFHNRKRCCCSSPSDCSHRVTFQIGLENHMKNKEAVRYTIANFTKVQSYCKTARNSLFYPIDGQLTARPNLPESPQPRCCAAKQPWNMWFDFQDLTSPFCHEPAPWPAGAPSQRSRKDSQSSKSCSNSANSASILKSHVPGKQETIVWFFMGK